MAVSLALMGCMDTKKKKEDNPVEPSPEVTITMEKLTGSPEYADAVLALQQPAGTEISSPGAVDFEFEVSQYELGAQTGGPNAEMLANSGKGQHIHFILDNQPYSAHYEPAFSRELPEGVHHLVAFLSRSYHESVKNPNSVVVRKMSIGENPVDEFGLDMEAPTLIYSRPKGTYSGADAENLMLDFFVLNAELSEDGYKVRATVNGEEFILTEWAPYVFKGLPKGEVTIQLELIDAEGNWVEGPFNRVQRKVMLEE